jgi:serine palmitoyltransferase
MPRRFSNPFASNTTTTSVSPAVGDKVTLSSRANCLKPTRFVQYFSSPKSKADAQTATAALLAAAHQQALHTPSTSISSPSLSLPTISLSTATADSANMDEPPTTLFQPPSPAEARRIARQHAQFGPLGAQSHRYTSRYEKGKFPEPITDEPPYYYLLTTYISYLILILFGHVLYVVMSGGMDLRQTGKRERPTFDL